jgi:prolyl oligopeptidase
MKTFWLLLLASAAFAGPPPTRRESVTDNLHGLAIQDPYRWLEDQNSPETRAWIESQNRYTKSMLDVLPGRKRLAARLEQLLRIDVVGVPIARGGRYFFRKRSAQQEQFVIAMRHGSDGKEEILVDPHSMSKDATISAGIADISQDGLWLAYWIQQGGEDERRIRILNTASRRHLPDELPKSKVGSVSILPDKSAFYYAVFGSDKPRIYLHRMGTPVSQDKEVFGEGYGARHILVNNLSDDGRYLIIGVFHGSSGDHTELFVQDLTSSAPPVQIGKGIRAAFFGEVAGDRLIVRTNWKAPNWRVLSVRLNDPAPEKWTEIIPPSDAVIDKLVLTGGKILLLTLKDVQPYLRLHSLSGKLERSLSLPGLGSVSRLAARFSSPELFFEFVSFNTPPLIFREDLSKSSQSVWARLDVPFPAEQYEVYQVWYKSKDGTRVPMFLFHRKGLARNGANPVLLSGYGGFNVSNTPGFSSFAAVWAEQGGVYAVANLRGGAEFGEAWHTAGMLANKQNVFDDFIAAAEWLIAEKYTNPKKLAIEGTSNGGLLVGAAMTQRPQLFQAVLCGYPLLDMVRYHKFLVARFWVPEYGSSDDPEQFRYLRAYSPYHNVKPGTKYPATMIITGDADTRVDPLHGRKMAALLQSAAGESRPMLLLYDTQAGHSGGLSVTRSVEKNVDQLSFLFWQLGLQLD